MSGLGPNSLGPHGTSFLNTQQRQVPDVDEQPAAPRPVALRREHATTVLSSRSFLGRRHREAAHQRLGVSKRSWATRDGAGGAPTLLRPRLDLRARFGSAHAPAHRGLSAAHARGPASATPAMAAAAAGLGPAPPGRRAGHLTRLRAEETQGKSLSPQSELLPPSSPPPAAAGILRFTASASPPALCRRRRPSSSAAPSVGAAAWGGGRCAGRKRG